MPEKGVRYREVIRAPLWLIAFVYFLFLSLVLSIWAALGNTPSLANLHRINLLACYFVL